MESAGVVLAAHSCFRSKDGDAARGYADKGILGSGASCASGGGFPAGCRIDDAAPQGGWFSLHVPVRGDRGRDAQCTARRTSPISSSRISVYPDSMACPRSRLHASKPPACHSFFCPGPSARSAPSKRSSAARSITS